MSGPSSQFVRATVYCRKETERGNTAKIAPNNQSYDVKIRASTSKLARDGGIIESDAWKDGLASYRRNPVIQFAHRYDQPPVGQSVYTDIDKKDGSLVQYVRWLDGLSEDPYDQLAHRLRRLYETGGMRTWSVGFRILEWRDPTNDEKSKALKKNQKIYWVATKAELLETSAVPVPADAGAVTVEKQIAAAVKNPTFDAEPLVRAWEAAKREAPNGGMPVAPTDEPGIETEAMLDYIDELSEEEQGQRMETSEGIHVSSSGDIHFHLTTVEPEDEPEKPAATEETEGETVTEDVEAEAETTEPEAEPDAEKAPEEEPEPEPAVAEATEPEPEAVAAEKEEEVEPEVEIIEPTAEEEAELEPADEDATVIEVELEEGQEPEEAVAEALAEKFAQLLEERLDEKLRQITGGAN
jgi:hypothetical protein